MQQVERPLRRCAGQRAGHAAAGRARRRLAGAALAASLLCLGAGGVRAADPVPEVSVEDAARRLAPGGFAVLMRHASTEPGTGDPAGFSPGNCATQRNLSSVGRAEAAAAGQALRARGVRFDDVRASAWCRCVDTARLGFGEPRVWAPLDSFFDDPARGPSQTEAVRVELQRVTAPRNLLLVTHQVNITALTGVYPASGEMVAMRWRDGAARAEFRFKVAASDIQIRR